MSKVLYETFYNVGGIDMNDAQKEQLIENMTANLPVLRSKADLTQARLSEMIGVSRQTLVAVENKKRKMSWSTFLSCCLVFKANPETRKLLDIYHIATDELENYLGNTQA